MKLSEEIDELYRDAREEIYCDECLSKDSNICPCNEVVRLRRLVDDVVRAERERCIKTAQECFCVCKCVMDFCGHCAIEEHWNIPKDECLEMKRIRKAIEKGGNENERQIES